MVIEETHKPLAIYGNTSHIHSTQQKKREGHKKGKQGRQKIHDSIGNTRKTTAEDDAPQNKLFL